MVCAVQLSTLEAVLDAARSWAADDPDLETQREAHELIKRAAVTDGSADARSAEAQLRDAFSGRLSFGTAGLRGELGAGPRRMNRVVVSQTSAGFAAFLHERAALGETSDPPSIVIGYDGRVNSDRFARDAAEIMAGSGVRVTLLPEPLPTPITAFAVRHLGVSAGVMITASHNPPRDNGYKVYLGDADDGSQIIPPSDASIAAQIERIAALPLHSLPRSSDYVVCGDEVRDAYVAATVRSATSDALSSVPSGETSPADAFVVAYTAMHGVGADTARLVFQAAGLPELHTVAEQDRPDGQFPTVAFPNPEEPGALDLAIETAHRVSANLIVAHDPDADRLAIALPHSAEASGYRSLTGNQLGLLLGWRAAARFRSEQPHAPGALSCTIVSSPALRAVAAAYDLDYAETLSGFKWVSRVPHLVFGFEEALGYLSFPDIVHDKDGISASADLVALACELAAEGRTLWHKLDEATERFGHFASAQVTIRLESMAAAESLSQRVRENPPTAFGASVVTSVQDLLTPGVSEIPANVLRYDLSDGSRVMVRPSGTEAKLKIYIDTFSDTGSISERRADAESALERIEAAVTSYLAEAQNT